jgi:hypothetical protein
MGPFQRRILIAAGLCFAADSMEILLLSFLAVVLQSEWNLTEDQTHTQVVFKSHAWNSPLPTVSAQTCYHYRRHICVFISQPQPTASSPTALSVLVD